MTLDDILHAVKEDLRRREDEMFSEWSDPTSTSQPSLSIVEDIKETLERLKPPKLPPQLEIRYESVSQYFPERGTFYVFWPYEHLLCVIHNELDSFNTTEMETFIAQKIKDGDFKYANLDMLSVSKPLPLPWP
jgi:hypothetical protein